MSGLTSSGRPREEASLRVGAPSACRECIQRTRGSAQARGTTDVPGMLMSGWSHACPPSGAVHRTVPICLLKARASQL